MKKKLTALILAALMCMGSVSFAENETTEATSDSEASVTAEATPTPEADGTEAPEPSAEADEETESTQAPEATAEPTEAPEATPAPANLNALADTVEIRIDMAKHPLVKDSFVKLELYSMNNELLGTGREWVGGITESVNMSFSVPQYTLGQSFKVKFVEGMNSLTYYDDTYYPGSEFTVQTYGYESENGEYVKGNSFIFSGDPYYHKAVVMYNQKGMMPLSPKARIIDGITYVPIRQIAESLGLKVRYDAKYNSVAVNVGTKEVAYNIGSDITNYFGTDKKMQGNTRSIEGYVFVPIRSLAEAFETGIEVKDFGDHIDVIIGESKVVSEYYNSFHVNQAGIGSKTNYLIWVSKSEYKVRVYKGQVRHWTPVAEFTCAIGAPGTPTITGQYDYFSRESVWDYGSYYVGPIMRFYNGYAIHSTLRYYGGGEYDGRVGVQISHGCIRLHPQDIEWMVSTIPLYTRVYITN